MPFLQRNSFAKEAEGFFFSCKWLSNSVHLPSFCSRWLQVINQLLKVFQHVQNIFPPSVSADHMNCSLRSVHTKVDSNYRSCPGFPVSIHALNMDKPTGSRPAYFTKSRPNCNIRQSMEKLNTLRATDLLPVQTKRRQGHFFFISS